MERAKSHPIFPVVDYIAKKIHAQHQMIVGLEAKVLAMHAEVEKFSESQNDVKELVKERSLKLKNRSMRSVHKLWCVP